MEAARLSTKVVHLTIQVHPIYLSADISWWPPPASSPRLNAMFPDSDGSDDDGGVHVCGDVHVSAQSPWYRSSAHVLAQSTLLPVSWPCRGSFPDACVSCGNAARTRCHWPALARSQACDVEHESVAQSLESMSCAAVEETSQATGALIETHSLIAVATHWHQMSCSMHAQTPPSPDAQFRGSCDLHRETLTYDPSGQGYQRWHHVTWSNGACVCEA